MVDVSGITTESAWAALGEVLDPEVPALSVVDLGIVRGLEVDGDSVIVTVTPTYSGCPAVQVIERDIVAALLDAGAASVQVRTVYSPPWTTDWMSEEGREKLREYGIAPPGSVVEHTELVPLLGRNVADPVAPACPFCGSSATAIRSEFGSTACKALAFCDECRQPFELFKSI